MRTMLDLAVKGLAACAAAFQFLTRLPVPVQLVYSDALFRRSVVFYPLVGVVLGLLLSAAAALLEGRIFLAAWLEGMGSGVTAALLLAAWIGMTGALHLDGLMDTADGVLSQRSRERMLEIMKDSSVGAMGVVACAIMLLCKWALLEQWLTMPYRASAYALPLVLLWSRWFMVVAIALWPYARTGEHRGNGSHADAQRGLGSFFRGLGVRHLLLHTMLAVMLSVGLLWLAGTGPAVWVRVIGVIATATVALGTWMSFRLSRTLGGLTGDTYGAMNEILEAALLLILYIVLQQ
ncbi:adenosylcobinamide-GDP ribazoletransferase [Paenibacillus xerothermodurans]|uniref:Adenosylcobinamide-GDP ribazoletransferase n=1 Tax=Paenibacillus xerothermodurans TaxID=1977292 RepID=A0A2W1N8X9_PAEXE|nr:adenosylcobinamide-GDP ribazoletransferase [Paenibacillus xerothermodurans]PZE20374.1 adenosylcobinamide-GDP ribazoletransferase [Paenibacillus xerothermodurans]